MKPWLVKTIVSAFVLAAAGYVVAWPVWVTKTLIGVQADIGEIKKALLPTTAKVDQNIEHE